MRLPKTKAMQIAIGSLKGGVGATTLTVNLAVVLQRAGHCVALIESDCARPVSQWVQRRQAAGLGTIEHRQATADERFEDSGHPYTLIDVGTCVGSAQILLKSADIWLAPTPPTSLEIAATLKLFQQWQEVRSTRSKPGLFAAALNRVGFDERDLESSARRKLSVGGPNLLVLNQSLSRFPAWDDTYSGRGVHELAAPTAARAGAELHAMSIELLSAALKELLPAPVFPSTSFRRQPASEQS